MDFTNLLYILSALVSIATVKAGETKNVTITVRISFHGKQPASFKDGSCLVLTAAQAGIMDAPAIEFARSVIKDPKLEAGSLLKEKITFPLPKFEEGPREIDVSATINNGWCSAEVKKEWIRKGDYLTDTSFSVKLGKEDSLEQYLKMFLVAYV